MASFVKHQKGKDLRSGLSKWELEELTKDRRKILGKNELHREILADGLRCPLCFLLPCAIIAFILLILMGVYIVHPYVVGKSLIKTQCRYNRTEYEPSWSGYCSHRTNHFKPCFKIIVHYNTITVNEAILQENEQALVHCNKCSFTQGRSGMFNKRTRCSWNSDVEISRCIPEYLKRFGVPNATYPCYYDPKNTQNVIATLKVTAGEAALVIVIPLVLLILWLIAFAVMVYDRYRRRIMDGQILVQRQAENKLNGNVRTNGTTNTLQLRTNVDLSEASVATECHTDTTTVTPKRKRKKKLPCRKPHFQFNYLDEGIVLEDKPISPVVRNQPLDFNYLTIDTSPTCNCNQLDSIDVVPHLGDHYTSQTPSYGSPRRPGTILKYLPESFV